MEDYASQVIHDLDKTGVPITAAEAQKLVSDQQKPNTLNYSLTIRRVFEYIRAAAGRGDTRLHFQAPSYVMGGTVCDPILLARQVKKRLTAPSLGFKVVRDGDNLEISWETN